MNMETIKYISKIAGMAAAHVQNGGTLKAAKVMLSDDMNAETTRYAEVDGVDFEAVNARVNLLNAVNINTKAGFIRQCETVVRRMSEFHDAAIFDMRVNVAIKIAARDYGVELHAADVIEWAAGDIYFNPTKCAKELAEAQGVQTEVTGETVRIGQTIEDAKGRRFVVDQVDRMAGYTDVQGYAVGSNGDLHDFRYVRFNTCSTTCPSYGVRAVRLVKDIEVTPELIEACHDEAIKHDAHLFACYLKNSTPEGWKVFGEARGVFAAEQRRKSLEAAHVEALKENDRFDWLANRYALFFAGCDFGARRTMIETAHSEALYIEKENAYITAKEHDTMINAMRGCKAMGEYHAANPDTLESAEDRAWRELPDALLPPVKIDVQAVCDRIAERRNKGGRPRKVLAAVSCIMTSTYKPLTMTNAPTYEVQLNNGKCYVYVTGIRRLYLLCGGRVRHYLKVIRNARVLEVVEAAISERRA